MKLVFSKKAYEQLDESRNDLIPIPCDCIKDNKVNEDCEFCDGGGIVYESPLSPEDASTIEENFRRQGIPIGKAN